MLMLDLKRAEERTEMEGWVDADDLERELGIKQRKLSKNNRRNKRAL